MRISFKRNGFIALASMLSFAVYAGDNLPLATAASGTNGSIQVSEHGVDTSNEIQQARVIQGTVLEEGTNEPLIGVNVVVKGTTIGTTTDVEGKYSIRIPSDNAVLVFSYIGQKTEEYSVKGLKSLDVIMVEKGLDIVRECRERYDGRVRNPFNEIECGHWYARAMASYGMLQGLTGVRYDAVDKTMYIDSKIGDFKSFISTDTGFGTIEWKAGKPVLNVVYGNIEVKCYNVSGKIVD